MVRTVKLRVEQNLPSGYPQVSVIEKVVISAISLRLPEQPIPVISISYKNFWQ